MRMKKRGGSFRCRAGTGGGGWGREDHERRAAGMRPRRDAAESVRNMKGGLRK